MFASRKVSRQSNATFSLRPKNIGVSGNPTDSKLNPSTLKFVWQPWHKNFFLPHMIWFTQNAQKIHYYCRKRGFDKKKSDLPTQFVGNVTGNIRIFRSYYEYSSAIVQPLLREKRQILLMSAGVRGNRTISHHSAVNDATYQLTKTALHNTTPYFIN